MRLDIGLEWDDGNVGMEMGYGLDGYVGMNRILLIYLSKLSISRFFKLILDLLHESG